MTWLRIASAAALAGALTWTAPAGAVSKKEASYAFDRVWPAAVRFLRVDENVTIVEKDRDAGYVLFELVDDGKSFRGALELVRITDRKGRAAVRLILRVQDRPSYVESLLLKKLMRKIVAELGSPPPPPPPPPADEPGDSPAPGGDG